MSKKTKRVVCGQCCYSPVRTSADGWHCNKQDSVVFADVDASKCKWFVGSSVRQTRDELAAASRQSSPVGNGPLVLNFVIDDLQARAKAGQKKYGTMLRARNGRDALLDAYQEALDLVMYLRQVMLERDGK